MPLSPETVSNALFRSLTEAPLLLGDLPEGTTFPCLSLTPPKEATVLNLQQKLGHLYEDALAVMLESTPRYDSLAQSLQIRQDAGHTLGELDFLVRDLVSDQLIHLELAVKFYLAVETENGVLLPGPDARDNYFRKLEKMRSHQLLLVKKFRDLLPETFQTKKIVVQQLVHGCIFGHIHADKPAEAAFLNPQGRRGKWLHAKECPGYFGENAHLEIIPKPLWPVPLNILQEAMKGIALEQWEHWQPNEKTTHCVMVRATSSKAPGDTPYFIAPNDYPLHRKT